MSALVDATKASSESAPKAAETKEERALNAMRERFGGRDGVGMPVDDALYLRYLRARNFNSDKAIAMLEETLKWRADFGIKNMLAGEWKDTLLKENETAKMYVRGFDNEGHVVLHMKPQYENTKNHDGNIKNVVFTLEKATAIMRRDGRQEKLVLLIDYEGYSVFNAPPMKTSMETLAVLQNHYPERLFKAYMLRPPWIFNAFWNVIYPFVDPVTQKKINFIPTTKEILPQLSEFIAGGEAAIETYLGGQDDSGFDHHKYLDGAFDLEYNAIIKAVTDAAGAAGTDASNANATSTAD